MIRFYKRVYGLVSTLEHPALFFFVNFTDFESKLRHARVTCCLACVDHHIPQVPSKHTSGAYLKPELVSFSMELGLGDPG